MLALKLVPQLLGQFLRLFHRLLLHPALPLQISIAFVLGISAFVLTRFEQQVSQRAARLQILGGELENALEALQGPLVLALVSLEFTRAAQRVD